MEVVQGWHTISLTHLLWENNSQKMKQGYCNVNNNNTVAPIKVLHFNFFFQKTVFGSTQTFVYEFCAVHTHMYTVVVHTSYTTGFLQDMNEPME